MTVQTIIITGASRGIGRAAVYQAIQHFNCNVIGVARSEEHLVSLANEEALKDRFKYVVGDVADEKTMRDALELARSSWSGQLHGLVLNAAIAQPIATVAESNIADWKRLYDINFFSLITSVSAALPALRETKGRIILVGSSASKDAIMGWGAYCSSKAAINMLAEVIAIEEQDITIVSFHPGLVDTELMEYVRATGAESMGIYHPEFVKLQTYGLLIATEIPGYVLANLAVNATKDLSGKFVRIDDADIKERYGKKN